MVSNKTDWIEKEIAKLKSAGLYNEAPTLKSPVSAHVKLNGKPLVNFASNNYLGLASDKRIINAACAAMKKYGVGPAAVRSIAGTSVLHKKLEKELAKFKKAEKVLTFQSGFAANLATIPALVGEEDVIFSDELNHASIIDGCRLSKAKVVRYQHNNARDLEKQIKAEKGYRRALSITDGVFSMDGDIADLPGLVKIADKHKILLMVDDAHGEGVLGKGGRGIVDHFDLHGKVDIEVGTMSKAFGVVGGLVAGKKVIIEWLSQRARPFLFSSAMTIPDVAACLEAVKILTKSDNRVKKLWENAGYLKDQLSILGFDLGKSETPIVPVIIGEEKTTREFARRLREHAIFAMPITYPTVALGRARIRLMNSAIHSKEDLDHTAEAFAHVGKELKIIQ
ncbi:glycine C-acetyltransferase [Candidatus Woesebacteria bacterium RIFCSPHIGHO2_01_FULL_44_21]|uniref:Glycine C-acetyltransferase n=1 Tax=Candidatus Woesebacteria bacterium RIFCSPHIGHO2_01_FULL_44_21 TaxID=1802503 RepID=A0A1F7YWT4_9BACT|nr:MAG: glycine C-acetyltransferase [Candidatus Woesebacteria bacterium RIFCSPHIGHO2_01_FULL_44_21]OGM71360.1 MAG: glycine C-acetyltransferase [Candidatus Woesebacteria bacterium RIFCSPLOWO2_01_FULL_44_24b]